MWIRNVDVPAALVDAHRSGGLVIFVGAGASLTSPSDLPGFWDLTAGIAEESGVPIAADEQRLDVVLGDLKDEHHVDVHWRVKTRLDQLSSRPNRLHEAIVSLAAASPTARIVTTNYDQHLSAVVEHRGLMVEEYQAPALPVGDNFAGLVYLHGRLSQDPSSLVVTDTDFGRAYLTDAWAARFLERMFAEYTVLFVGYSHRDVVMQYLARGLGRTTRPRYALASAPAASHWRRLSIEPLEYPVDGDSHAALPKALERWAELSSMGLLEHRQQVMQLVSGPPSQIPEDTSYLETALADNEKVGFFTEHARGIDWLAWAATRPEFRLIFEPTAEPPDSSRRLAYWFAQHYAMNEELTDEAMAVVQAAGGRLGYAAWWTIAQRLHGLGQPRPAWSSPWLVLLIQQAPDSHGDLLDYLLDESSWPDDRATALLLFDHLTEPLPSLRRPIVPGAAHVELRFRGSAHWLQQAWTNLFAPNLGEGAADVLAVADRHLRRAHHIYAAAGAISLGRDPMSAHRSAIQPHPQDSHPEPADVLIDAARDSLELALDSGSDFGPAYLNMWSYAEAPILRRLAVHGWTHRSDVDASAKISWLTERAWLFNLALRHEVFRLIETSLSDASDDVGDALVAQAEAGPDIDGVHRDYEIFNSVSWMARHAPDLRSAAKALERATLAHPEFEPTARPDLLSWFEVGTAGPQPPMAPEQLHDHIACDPQAAIVELRHYEEATFPVDGPTWGDAIGVLSEVVHQWPTDGFTVLDADGGTNPDIVRGVIRGWAASTLEDGTAEAITVRLADTDLAELAADVAHMLADGGRDETSPTEWHRYPSARILASRVWAAIGSAVPPTDVDDWLGRAINRPAGRLAQFWTHAVAHDWRTAGDSWGGIPPETQSELQALLEGDDERTALAAVVLASQLHFYFTADSEWCQDWILPLLDWTNPMKARRAWDGFLIWGRWSDKLLTAGLMKYYVAAAQHIDEFSDELRRQLGGHLASVATRSDLNPIDDGWLRTFTTTVEPGVRTEWMNQIAWTLKKLPGEAVEHQWQRWMRHYWQDRLDSVPTQLTIQEASAMAAWVAYLTDSVADGVALATSHAAGLGEHADILHDLTSDRIVHNPAAFAELLTHLLKGTQQPFYGCHYLREVTQALKDQDIGVEPIIEQALRLGCIDAPAW
jgi:hypothetical protein